MNKRIIISSLITCTIGSIVGYFCFFIGGHISEGTKEFSLFLIPGYILLWPAILFGIIQNSITGDNAIGWITGWASQIIGYIFMGYLYGYVHKTAKTHNKTLKQTD